MKIKGISMLIALAFVAFGFSISIANAVEVGLEAETTLALCSDGIDNDDNGSADSADANCDGVLAEEVVVPVLVLENTAELCADGIDNDDNGSADAADENCAEFSGEVTVPVLLLENTFALCHDGIDNDDNGSSDMADENCADHGTETPALVLENTAELCADGIDNDDNGSADAADENCGAFVNPNNGGGDNGSDNDSDDDDDNKRSSRSGQKKSSNRSNGEVLGASTDSCPLITSYMRMGWANDASQVSKLQEFLNKELGISLPVTGFFGQLTQNAVNAFQLKYKNEVLKPWVDAGLHDSVEIPTGFVYITTTHMINEIACPDFDEKLPALVPASN